LQQPTLSRLSHINALGILKMLAAQFTDGDTRKRADGGEKN